MASGRPTYGQIEYLVEFLEQNPGIAKGLLRTMHAKIETKRKWAELAGAINALGGAQKNGQGWAKYWAEKKCALKKQCAQLNASARLSGGSFDSMQNLSALDKRLVAVMGGQESETTNSQVPATAPVNPSSPSSQMDSLAVAEAVLEPEEVKESLSTSSDTGLSEDPLNAPPTLEPSNPTPRQGNNPRRRQRPCRGIDVEMDRLAQMEERRVEAELKTAQALADMATAMNRIAAALEKLSQQMSMQQSQVADAAHGQMKSTLKWL